MPNAARHEQRCLDNRRRIAEGLKATSKLMTALGDETRQDIVLILLDAGESGLRVGEITEATHLSRPAVSHHIKVLKDAGVVCMHKEGTMNFYHLDPESEQWQTLRSLSGLICGVIDEFEARKHAQRR